MNIALPDTSLVPDAITATLIPDEQRLSFWPQHFSTVMSQRLTVLWCKARTGEEPPALSG